MSTDATPRLQLPFMVSSQAQKEITHNEALTILDTVVNAVFIDQLTAPPGTFAEGDSFIVAATATGPWTGKENCIAKYQNSSWFFFTPFNGMTAMKSDGVLWKFLNNLWSIFTSGSTGTVDHSQLTHRDSPDQHPTSAIIGLDTALSEIYDLEFNGGTCGDAAFSPGGQPAENYVTGGTCGDSGNFPSYIMTTEIGQPNGVAGLDGSGFFNPKTPTGGTHAVNKSYVDAAVANAAPVDGVELKANKDTANGYLGANGAGLLPYSKLDDKFEYLTFEGNTTSTTAWWNGASGVIVDRTVYVTNDLIGRLVNMQVSFKAPSSFASGAWLPVPYPIVQPLGNDYYRIGGNYIGAQDFGTGLFYRITLQLLKNA